MTLLLYVVFLFLSMFVMCVMYRVGHKSGYDMGFVMGERNAELAKREKQQVKTEWKE